MCSFGVKDQRNWNHKLIHKEHADNKRGATESPVAPEDLVLLKNTKMENFESEPYTVQNKEGSEVTVSSKKGVEYRLNASRTVFMQIYNFLLLLSVCF